MPAPSPPPNVTRTEACGLAMARKVAAMLDIEPDALAEGTPLPRGWQFILLAADTPRARLRSDGFPGLGVPMPDLGLPRLLQVARSVTFHADIPIGATVQRQSRLLEVSQKETPSGPRAMVSVQHELRLPWETAPVLQETQTYLLLAAESSPAGAATTPSPARAQHERRITPDETLLFQYSALSFNSHRIHLDRAYAQRVEGFPDLVVNGGVTALLLTEFLRQELGVVPRAIAIRYRAPLFCNRPITLTADRDAQAWRLKALNENGKVAADMEVDVS